MPRGTAGIEFGFFFPVIFWKILIPNNFPTSDKFRTSDNSSKNLPQNHQHFQKNIQNKYKEKIKLSKTLK